MRTREPYEGRLVNTVGVALFLGLVGAVALAAITRPVDRAKLPRTIAEVQPELAALHKGEGACARWGRDRGLTEEALGDFARELSSFAAVDLHVALPILSHLRVSNHDREGRQHTHNVRHEVIEVSLRRLSRFERLRLGSDTDKINNLMPLLQTLEDDPPRLQRDRRRASFFLARLDESERKALDALLDGWRDRLTSPVAQGILLDYIAEQVTHKRMASMSAGLEDYHLRYGRFPTGLRAVLEHMARIDRVTPTLDRGRERDGTLRDGWLRPFVYYTRGPDAYRLISEGTSGATEDDDIVEERSMR